MGGQFNTWSQRDANTQSANDAGENPTLASCNEPIVRVVPNDTSGMTQAVLSGGPDDGTSTCTPLAPILLDWTALWNDLATQGNNDLWPGEDGSEGHPGDTWPVISDQSGCSGVTQSGQPGDASLLQILHNKAGGVGYASVADIKHDTSTNSGSGQYEATLVTFKVAYYETTAFTSATTRS